MKKLFIFVFILLNSIVSPNILFFIFNNEKGVLYNFLFLLLQILVIFFFSIALSMEIHFEMQKYIYKNSYTISANKNIIYNKILKIWILIVVFLWQILLISNNIKTSLLYILSSNIIALCIVIIGLKPDLIYINKSEIFFTKSNIRFNYKDIKVSVRKDNLTKTYELIVHEKESDFKYKTNDDTLNKIVMKLQHYTNINVV